MTKEKAETPAEKRRQLALRLFREYPDKIPSAIQENILANRIALGMTPYDCYLAGGAFMFKVSADSARWGKNADPYDVMWAQSVAPDASEIWMTFETDTQYPGKGTQRFRVHFLKGKAVEILKLEHDK